MGGMRLPHWPRVERRRRVDDDDRAGRWTWSGGRRPSAACRSSTGQPCCRRHRRQRRGSVAAWSSNPSRERLCQRGGKAPGNAVDPWVAACTASRCGLPQPRKRSVRKSARQVQVLTGVEMRRADDVVDAIVGRLGEVSAPVEQGGRVRPTADSASLAEQDSRPDHEGREKHDEANGPVPVQPPDERRRDAGERTEGEVQLRALRRTFHGSRSGARTGQRDGGTLPDRAREGFPEGRGRRW